MVPLVCARRSNHVSGTRSAVTPTDEDLRHAAVPSETRTTQITGTRVIRLMRISSLLYNAKFHECYLSAEGNCIGNRARTAATLLQNLTNAGPHCWSGPASECGST